MYKAELMEYRRLGRSGFKVPVLSFGAGTFAGKGELFKAWGDVDVKEATRMVDMCLENGVTLFDTADIYSKGGSEEILGSAIKNRRDQMKKLNDVSKKPLPYPYWHQQQFVERIPQPV